MRVGRGMVCEMETFTYTPEEQSTASRDTHIFSSLSAPPSQNCPLNTSRVLIPGPPELQEEPLHGPSLPAHCTLELKWP
jgi:hypothetical protein